MCNQKVIVGVVGSHGLYAQYGGWDNLVNKLCELKTDKFYYHIVNSKETPIKYNGLRNVSVYQTRFSAAGIEGALNDLVGLIHLAPKCKYIVLLGAQVVPFAIILSTIFRFKVISHVDGVEWKRPKFNSVFKLYFKMCFYLSAIFCSKAIFDNKNLFNFLHKKYHYKCEYIPYGSDVRKTSCSTYNLKSKYNFLDKKYFLSIGRPIEDNRFYETCSQFIGRIEHFVLISPLPNSKYGKLLINKFYKYPNIHLIQGLYNKEELYQIRKSSSGYIHSHTQCGTAPTLVEAIVDGCSIISYDNTQNRNTLNNYGLYYNSNKNLDNYLNNWDDFRPKAMIPPSVAAQYSWSEIVRKYERLYQE